MLQWSCILRGIKITTWTCSKKTPKCWIPQAAQQTDFKTMNTESNSSSALEREQQETGHGKSSTKICLTSSSKPFQSWMAASRFVVFLSRHVTCRCQKQKSLVHMYVRSLPLILNSPSSSSMFLVFAYSLDLTPRKKGKCCLVCAASESESENYLQFLKVDSDPPACMVLHLKLWSSRVSFLEWPQTLQWICHPMWVWQPTNHRCLVHKMNLTMNVWKSSCQDSRIRKLFRTKNTAHSTALFPTNLQRVPWGQSCLQNSSHSLRAVCPSNSVY